MERGKKERLGRGDGEGQASEGREERRRIETGG